ncbi:uncharacterized protein LOC130957654 [Arachis stenosperma]|uniref:uncharacterized protein LOC130957654 n=1 Tax=Arachis stenosperma TaxID=217475 RepID=UPI0025AD7785|nr:uncharacterized protein LOC130957654 [Arachis stenosperma]
MASEEESFLVLVHCSGKIKRSAKYGVKFTDREPLSVFISSSSTLSDVKNSILQKVGVFGGKWVKKLFYKILIAVVSTGVKYDTFVLAADENIRVLFHCVKSFSEVRIHELFTKLEVGVDSSGASALVHSSTAAGGVSSLMPAVRSSVPQVASPSFTIDLDRMEVVVSIPLENPKVWQQAFEVGTGGGMIHDVQGFGEPDGVENAIRDDDSDQEPVDIIGDIDDDTGANPHEAVLSVKDYSIRRGVEFRVLESDHLKYHGKCKEFGKGCSWLIRISLRAQKGTWEVKRYNSPHICLATSIFSYHYQLDYYVICVRIFPLVRADAAVTVKLLQQAIEADYEFRPSYRKVWMEKQKLVAQIYGDWEDSYAELPRWMLGVQSTMAGTVTVLKTSPVRLGDEVDESTVYFHRLFWTFPPCIETFRHYKPLVSIDGTHLYGKYGGTLLLAIARDGNSNILPIAFALVEGENTESWSFFLSNLRLHVTPQEGILVISDRHNGIKAALENPENGWLPPRAFRAYCIRHVEANFSLSFKVKDARRMLVNAAYAKMKQSFITGLTSCRLRIRSCVTGPTGWSMTSGPNTRIAFCSAHPRRPMPPYAGPTIIPDPNMRRAREGHPKATRIRSSMDQSVGSLVIRGRTVSSEDILLAGMVRCYDVYYLVVVV